MKYIVSLFVAFLLAVFAGCGVVRTLAGADIDPERFARAREAKMMDIRARSVHALHERLLSKPPIDNCDVFIGISEDALNRLARQYDSTHGWIDANTQMRICSAAVQLYNGVAIATLALDAWSNDYPVAVALTMDCILYCDVNEKMELVGKLEAFNIAPRVDARGLLSGQEELIRNLVAIKVAKLGEQLPPFVFPIDLKQQTAIDGHEARYKEKIDVTVTTPRFLVNTQLRLSEIVVMEKKLFIALNLKSVEVK